MTYEYTVQEGKAPFVNLAEKTVVVSSLHQVATPGTFLVDVISPSKAKLEHHSL